MQSFYIWTLAVFPWIPGLRYATPGMTQAASPRPSPAGVVDKKTGPGQSDQAPR